jgi:hypothetical protein
MAQMTSASTAEEKLSMKVIATIEMAFTSKEMLQITYLTLARTYSALALLPKQTQIVQPNSPTLLLKILKVSLVVFSHKKAKIFNSIRPHNLFQESHFL